MSDLGSLLRDHYEEVAPPIDVERLADRLLAEQRLRPAPARSRGVLIAVAAAVVVLLIIGGSTLLAMFNQAEVVDEPSTTVPSTTLPEDDAMPETVEPSPDQTALPPATEVGLPFSVLDSEGDVGAGASVVVGDDGMPLVAYAYRPVDDADPSEIRVVACTDPACREPGRVTTIAQILTPLGTDGVPLTVYVETRMVLPPDGLPLVVWSEQGESEDSDSIIRSFKCSDPECGSGTLNEPAIAPGSGLWVGIGADGDPLIARRRGDWNHVRLQLLQCVDPACSSDEESLVDLPSVGWGLAVALDAAGRPVIAAQLSGVEGEMATLGIGRCSDPLCTEPPAFTDTGVIVGELSAVGVDGRDRPVVLMSSTGVSGANGTNYDELVLAACSDPLCSTPPAVTTLAAGSEESGDISPFGSLSIADDGSVTIAHLAGGDLHVMTCVDPSCPGGPVDVALMPGLGGWPEVSLAVGANGNPVIAMHADSSLGVFACSDPTCAESQVVPLSDTPDTDWLVTNLAPADVEFSGTNPAIEIGRDGNPVIAYLGRGEEVTNDGGTSFRSVPKLVVCEDTNCSASTTRVLADQADWVAMTLLPDGRPVVVYPFWPDEGDMQRLMAVWCSDPVCSDWTTELIVESGWINSTLGLAARPNGSIVAAYQDTDDFYVSVVACDEGGCEAADKAKVWSLVDPNDNEFGQRWWMNSLDLALLPDGRPVIAAAQGNGEVRYVECLDAECSESERILVDKTLGDVTAGVAVGPSGLPVVAHYDDGELTITACHSGSCEDVTVSAIGDATGSGCGQVKPSIAFGRDGNPMITYWAPRALMVAACHDPMCASSSTDVFANVRTYDLAAFSNGSPVLAYFADSEQEPEPGEESCCGLVDLRLAVCTNGTCTGS